MIKYTVRCAKDHEFEGWFKDSATFDIQAKAGDVACPVCGNNKVGKAPMAPRIGKSADVRHSMQTRARDVARRYAEAATAIREHVEANCDYVGDRFPDEARKIHYGETEARGIYGEASTDDVKDLTDEGIEVAPLPIPRRDA